MSDCIATTPVLPWEIIDEILVCVGNVDLVLDLGRFSILNKIKKNLDSNWAIANGRLQYLKYLYAKGLWVSYQQTMPSLLKCAALNYLKVLKYYHENIQSIKLVTDLFGVASECGHLSLVKYLNSIGCILDSVATISNTTKNGHLEVIKWLHANNFKEFSVRAIDYAALNGHLEIIEFLHSNRKEGCTTDAMNFAACNGHLHVIIWLHLNRKEGCTTNAMDLAAKYGHLEVIKWLHSNRKEGCTARAMDNAAENGHFEIVMQLKTDILK
jgi:hypothetical protein